MSVKGFSAIRKSTSVVKPRSGLISEIQLVCKFKCVNFVSSASGLMSERPRLGRARLVKPARFCIPERS